MKEIFILSMVTAGVLFSGCAMGKSGLVLDTVGPMPGQTGAANSINGRLVVYSAEEVGADFNSRDPYRPEYSDYSIYATDGHLLRRVRNDSGTILQDPMTVRLPPGKYTIKAKANGYGYVTVPVVIQVRQTTVLHLEGGDGWSDDSVFNQTNAVRLPDDQIVGFKDTSNL
jgi:hypothetical protein